ncbi:MAG: response regulator [Nitrospirae bacterium]|nr:response regulator [Nitrospirota bacterium]
MKKEKILLVDDDEHNLCMYEAVLKNNGYEVVCAGNGLEAIERLRANHIDMIVSDILMPKMDGFSLCRECKKDDRFKKLPFIFISSAYLEEKDENFAMSLGVERFIRRPIGLAEFIRVIEDVIKKHRAGAPEGKEAPTMEEMSWLAEYNERLRIMLEQKVELLEREIGDRKLAEEALRESELTFRSIFDGANDGILLADRETKKFHVGNRAVCRLLGYEPEEIVNLGVADIHPAEHLHYVIEQFEKQARGEITLAKDIPVKSKDGSISYADISSGPITLGGRVYLMGVFRDITERKRAEEERARLQEQLRQSQKLEGIGQLAGGIAHDFNNILNTIIGFASLVQMTLPDDSPLMENINEVIAAGNRGSALTRQILAFSRKQALDVKAVNLNEIIQSIDKMLRRLIREDIQIEFVLSDTPLTVIADASQIDQILVNLAANARDGMTEGGELTISTSLEDIGSDFISVHGFGTAGRYALITVSDTGTGMDETTKERIFEPFFTTKESGKGTGLGLSVVYGIVKQHNGFIVVYSEPEKGTTFKIYLPFIAGEAEKELTSAAVHIQGGPETILLADDSESIINYLTEMLERFGYAVITAKDGNEAVGKFREHASEIKLLVMDVLMPYKGGKEAYDEIKRIRPDMKAVFMSGHSSDDIAGKRIVEEGHELISKPFKPDELLRKVRDVLNGSL